MQAIRKNLAAGLCLSTFVLATAAQAAECPRRIKVGGISLTIPCPTEAAPISLNEKRLCGTAYVGPNKDNASVNLPDETKMNDLATIKYARRSWHGGLNPHWSGKDRYWSDISSLHVASGCIIFVGSSETLPVNPWDDSSVVKYPGGSEGQDYFAPSFPQAGQVPSIGCSCGTIKLDDFALTFPPTPQ